MPSTLAGKNGSAQSRLCLVPEILDVVLHSTKVQSVGQGLVVGQSLGWWAPVHIWNGGHMQAETQWS